MIKYAIVFPGQGSQSKNILLKFSKYTIKIKKIFYKASNILKFDLLKLIENISYKDLQKTYITQPTVFVTSVAIWKIWKKLCKNNKPYIMAGHSLGEYTALTCNNFFSFNEGILLIKKRSQLMHKESLKNTGKMVAIIGLNYKTIKKICLKVSYNQIVSPASLNTKNQIVISGNTNAINRVIKKCKTKGAKIIPLNINIPSHCLLMKHASKKLATFIKKNINFSLSKIPIINNINAKIEKNPKKIIQALIKQMYLPIQWTNIIKYFKKINIKLCIEIGLKNILSNLNKQIDNSITYITINNTKSLHKALNIILKK